MGLKVKLSIPKGWGLTYPIKESNMYSYIALSAPISDLAILQGGSVSKYRSAIDENLEGRTGSYWINYFPINIFGKRITDEGKIEIVNRYKENIGIRPELSIPKLYKKINEESSISYKGIPTIKLGEYPTNAPDEATQKVLELLYNEEILTITNKTYQLNFNEFYDEYTYLGKKYIRYIVKLDNKIIRLSNDLVFEKNDVVWLEVKPITWYINKQNKRLVSKIILVSGIIKNKEKFLNDCMLPDIFNKSKIDKISYHDPSYWQTLNLNEDLQEEYSEYITYSYLNWARTNNIHPAIYSYITNKLNKHEINIFNPLIWTKASTMLKLGYSINELTNLLGEENSDELITYLNNRPTSNDEIIHVTKDIRKRIKK